MTPKHNNTTLACALCMLAFLALVACKERGEQCMHEPVCDDYGELFYEETNWIPVEVKYGDPRIPYTQGMSLAPGQTAVVTVPDDLSYIGYCSPDATPSFGGMQLRIEPLTREQLKIQMALTHPVFADLIPAMIECESGGDPNAMGDYERVGSLMIPRSRGILQIQQDVITDVNRHYGTDYGAGMQFNPDTAEEIAKLYMTMWCDRQDIPITKENCARVFNGGPDGWKQECTLEYWRKVKRAMEGVE